MCIGLQAWEGLETALIPWQCVVDLLANAYNTDSPTALTGVMQQLEPLVQESPIGLALDLDAMLEVLIAEVVQGESCVFPATIVRSPKILHKSLDEQAVNMDATGEVF